MKSKLLNIFIEVGEDIEHSELIEIPIPKKINTTLEKPIKKIPSPKNIQQKNVSSECLN